MDRVKALMLWSRRLVSARSGDDLFESFHDLATVLQTEFHIDSGFFLYYRKASDTLYRSSWGFEKTSQDVLQESVYAVADDYLPELQSTYGQWMPLDKVSPIWQEILAREGIKAVGVWLVMVDDDPLGVFILGHKTLDHAGDADLISICVTHISMMIEMVILRRTAEAASERDSLTGLLNRRGFLTEFDYLVSHAKPARTLMLAVIDVDGFKEINDELGHLAGDEVLVQMATTLQQRVNQYDGICARIGGDEFLLFAELDIKDVDAAAAQVAIWCAEAKVKASIGCAVYGIDGDDFETCFRAADQRLYEWKRIRSSAI